MISLFTSTMLIVSEAEESLVKLDQNWTGGFDQMIERHRIRALVPYSKTFYFLDGADQRGLTYDLLKDFEKHLNQKLGKKTLRVQLVVIPMPHKEDAISRGKPPISRTRPTRPPMSNNTTGPRRSAWRGGATR